jgi:hypothetical protein
MAPPRNTSLRYPGGRRALWGAFGFIVTYVVMVPVAMLKRETLLNDVIITPGGGASKEPISELIEFSAVADWEIAGLLAFNAHMTPLNIPVKVFENSVGGMGTANLVTTAGGPYLLLLLVPLLVYPMTGILATRNMERAIPSRRGYAAVMQFTGVLPLAIASVFLFSFPAQTGTAGPALMWGGVLVGFLYPAVGGYLGAVFAQRFTSSSQDSNSSLDSWGT